MKKHFAAFFCLMITVNSFSQEKHSFFGNQKDYLKKSKVHKAFGYSILGVGALFIIGNAVWNSDVENDTGWVLFPKTHAGYYIGGGLMVSSIPLFVAGAHNKNKALKMSAGIKFEHRKFPLNKIHFNSYPAVAIIVR